MIGTTAALRNPQLWSHAAAFPNGSAPGDVPSVYVAYSAPTPEMRIPKPTSSRSHPIGLLGSLVHRITLTVR
jgi:hypothetical protein